MALTTAQQLRLEILRIKRGQEGLTSKEEQEIDNLEKLADK